MPAIRASTRAELEAVLRRSSAELTSGEVHTLFLGALASPNLRPQPQRYLGMVFRDDPGEGLLIEEMLRGFAVVLGYWNHLVAERNAGRVQLLPPGLPDAAPPEALRAYATRRHGELVWFFRGLAAGEDDGLERDADAGELLAQLRRLTACLPALADVCARPADAALLARVRASVDSVVDTAQSMIADLLDLGEELRARALARPAAPPRGGAPHRRRARGDRCPCGSGKPRRRCCGAPRH